MKVYLIIILIFISCFSYSQKKQSNLYIKINTLSLVDVLSFPTLQLSLEKRISPSFSLNPEVGYQLYSENENKFLGGTSLDTVF